MIQFPLHQWRIGNFPISIIWCLGLQWLENYILFNSYSILQAHLENFGQFVRLIMDVEKERRKKIRESWNGTLWMISIQKKIVRLPSSRQSISLKRCIGQKMPISNHSLDFKLNKVKESITNYTQNLNKSHDSWNVNNVVFVKSSRSRSF